jgi:hypothetical protein
VTAFSTAAMAACGQRRPRRPLQQERRETEAVGRRSLPCRAGEKDSGGGDEDINTSATIIPSVEILVPITRS